MHRRIRVQISSLLLLSTATSTRPGALMESSSARGSSRPMGYERIEVIKVPDIDGPIPSTIAVRVSLVPSLTPAF